MGIWPRPPHLRANGTQLNPRKGRSMTGERHLVGRIGWLRAAVLGANDGIISTASLILSVASAASSQTNVLLAGIAGLLPALCPWRREMPISRGKYCSNNGRMSHGGPIWPSYKSG